MVPPQVTDRSTTRTSSRTSRDQRPLRVGAAAVLITASVAVCAIVLGWSGPSIDLHVFLLAGREFVRGGDLYEPSFGSGLVISLPYTYPPLLAALSSTVAWMPWSLVGWLWVAANVGALLSCTRRAYGPFVEASRYDGTILVATLAGLLALTAPITEAFAYGQVGLLLLAAILADTTHREGDRLPKGVLVGLATAIKLVPAIFLLYWIVTKQWRAAFVGCITAIGASLFAALLRPDLSRDYWLQILAKVDRIGGDLGIVANQSINGVLHRLGLSSFLTWSLLAGVVLVVGLTRARAAHLEGHELAAVTLVGVTSLLISPVSWVHHAVWIVPITGVLLGDGRSRGRWISWGAAIALSLLVTVLWPEGTDGSTGSVIFDNVYVWSYLVLLLALPGSRNLIPGSKIHTSCAP
jgi:alpha-1,2-mannosyltransferase